MLVLCVRACVCVCLDERAPGVFLCCSASPHERRLGLGETPPPASVPSLGPSAWSCIPSWPRKAHNTIPHQGQAAVAAASNDHHQQQQQAPPGPTTHALTPSCHHVHGFSRTHTHSPHRSSRRSRRPHDAAGGTWLAGWLAAPAATRPVGGCGVVCGVHVSAVSAWMEEGEERGVCWSRCR